MHSVSNLQPHAHHAPLRLRTTLKSVPSLPLDGKRRLSPLFPRATDQPEASTTGGSSDEYYGVQDEDEYRYPVTREETLQEYAELKEMINRRTLRFGAGLTGYLFFVASSEAALACLVGLGASMIYLRLLYRDVESYQAGQVIPMFEAEMEIRDKFQRNFTKALLAYPQALNVRLLVPIGLAFACWGYNQVVPEEYSLSPIELGAAMGGFLSYKVSFLLMLYDAYKPGADEGKKMSSRPVLAEVEDVTKDVDFKNPRVKNLKF